MYSYTLNCMFYSVELFQNLTFYFKLNVDTTLVMNHTTINTNREFHNEETSSYWLPKDEEEQQKLTAISKHEA
ncbi:hypothetical protein RO3G_04400 [Rhizopus delemar RA 99-880]|uniref:Uncharacterized protein n=1 Tax=Rhizopus delemar (strain RA 99-880 / ATCC MYA-4621 / FGSC 9543 / NRRL 43880) TaxID=246409 RepID=I1BU15_RHIO9|nr:hypothetical protein RO3G_04400 [Rhizopus delemar RA 99-880]|eukprot:EIE79695.1 hypothetical protein RO3G_04400 [Rhizopus delemar RA 99-880]